MLHYFDTSVSEELDRLAHEEQIQYFVNLNRPSESILNTKTKTLIDNSFKWEITLNYEKLKAKVDFESQWRRFFLK